MVIAFPPCTYLSHAGNAHWNAPGRAELREEAMRFFRAFTECDCPRVCIENPQGLPNSAYRRPDQMVEPFYFGDAVKKRTCLWLKNLPPLQWEDGDDFFRNRTAVPCPAPDYIHIRKPSKNYKGTEVKKRYFVDSRGGGLHRARERSKTFPGIAEAMAEQWG